MMHACILHTHADEPAAEGKQGSIHVHMYTCVHCAHIYIVYMWTLYTCIHVYIVYMWTLYTCIHIYIVYMWTLYTCIHIYIVYMWTLYTCIHVYMFTCMYTRALASNLRQSCAQLLTYTHACILYAYADEYATKTKQESMYVTCMYM